MIIVLFTFRWVCLVSDLFVSPVIPPDHSVQVLHLISDLQSIEEKKRNNVVYSDIYKHLNQKSSVSYEIIIIMKFPITRTLTHALIYADEAF